MSELEDFNIIFGSNSNVAYEAETRQQIIHHRRSLDNELFIDRLLKALGISKVSKSYPPESNQDLKNLHFQIISSSSPTHHKHSVLYYLLRDVAQSSHQSSERFAKASYLPIKYKVFIDGIWYLDRMKFERALDYLTEPSLIPTFPEEILYTLCRHSPNSDVTLPVAYYQAVQPCINSNKVMEAYYSTLCRASITEAFYFSRAQGDTNHRVLLEKLITFVLSKSAGKIKAARGLELIGLPLNQEEENWFTEFLRGSGNKLPGAADTLIMWGIAVGRSEVVMQHRRIKSSEKLDAVNWETLSGRCKNEHPNNSAPAANNRNPFAPFQSNPRGNNVASGPNRVPLAGRDSRDNRGNPYKLDKTTILNDLDPKERPQWILSAYGPGSGAPLQLFGGDLRELSFEELRTRHYELAAQGKQQQAIQEAQTLVNNAEQQMQNVLNDVDGAIKYIMNGENEHPNRTDITNAKGHQSTLGQTPAPSTFARPSLPAFAQSSAPTPSFGQPSSFGQPTTLGRPTTSFGQPTLTLGQSSMPTSSFGQPAVSQSQNPFGQALASAQPSLFNQSSVSSQAKPFGQVAAPTQTGIFGRPTAPTSFNQSTNAEVGSTAAAPSNAFNQTSGSATSTTFGQPSTAAAGPLNQNALPAANILIAKAPAFNGTAAGAQVANGIPWDSDKKITNWKGMPVSYQDGKPCFRGNDGNWTRIWFPHGGPVFVKTPELPESSYSAAIKDEYLYAKQHGSFQGGTMPEMPPRREWCSWDF